MKTKFLDDASNFTTFEAAAKDFLGSFLGSKEKTMDEKMRAMENETIMKLQEAKHSAYEIKDKIAKLYKGHEFCSLHPSDVHLIKFNKKDNSIVYKIGTHMQSAYLDLIVGWK